MKLPKLSQVLLTTTLTLAFASSLVTPARAELVSEDVQADSITPESTSGMEEEMVILKKAPAKKIVVREQALPSETMIATPVAMQAAPVAAPQAQAQASAQATATATATAAAGPSRPSVGSSLDQGMSNKMDDVRNQFENALLRTLDRIKITVDDGAPAASASAQATAIAVAAPVAAPAPAAAPTTTVINDSVLNATAAPANYMTVQNAPLVREDEEEEEEGTSVARREDSEDRNFTSRLRLTPKAGYTSIRSDFYDIKSNVTLGIDLEMEVSENFAAYLGYSFAKYDLGLTGYGGGYDGGYGGGFGGYSGAYSTLQYNQNVFELGGRFYILPQSSAFRVFVGGGIGLNKGYINYRNVNQYQGYGYGAIPSDYELNSWLGIIETGAEFRVARNVSIGANFKYNTVLGSSESDRIRNFGFYSGGAGLTQEQIQAGGSLANESFYSLMGAVKVNF